MIRLLKPAALPTGLDACQTVCAARICTLRDAWAGLPIRCDSPDFYGVAAGAVLAVFGGVCTLEGAVFDPQELLEFLRMRGCQTLVCGEEAARRLPPGIFAMTKSPVLRRKSAGTAEEPRICWSPPLAQIYHLLAGTFNNMADVQFDMWYADLSLKLRRGIASIGGILENGALCSTAGIYHRNACTAVLGSVATRPEARGRGGASTLVDALATKAHGEGRAALIVALNPYAQALYERLGFAHTGALYEITLADTKPGAVHIEQDDGKEADN